VDRGSVTVLFESQPLEFRRDSVVLDRAGAVLEIPNDYAWIFAGGTLPMQFLKEVGVAFVGAIGESRQETAVGVRHSK
jgi:hypothetical protein